MAEIKAEICTIKDIQKIDNADSLEVATVKGWNCVIKKGTFSVGDKCIYVPVDACITKEMEAVLFKNAKVKLNKGRIKTIKLRGVISQGLVVDPNTFNLEKKPVGADVTTDLGITKYEPPLPGFQSAFGKRAMPRKQNENFKKYTSIENGKNYTEVFEQDELIYVTEKLHGTNFRAGWVPRQIKNVFQRIYAWFKKDYSWEFIVGSHNIQLRDTARNVYCDIAKKYQLKEKLPKGYVVYGEIIGDGIQKGYDYGLTEKDLVVFDIIKDGQYMDFSAVPLHCAALGLKLVPILSLGPWKNVKMEKYLPVEFISGPSVFCPAQKVREGVVIRSGKESTSRIGRKVVKYINPTYLLDDDNTDFH